MKRLSIVAAFVLLGSTLLFLVASSAGAQREAARPLETVKVLIAFDRQPGPDEVAIVRGAGGVVKHTYHLVPAIAASLPAAAIEGLSRNPRVTLIEPDIEAYAIDAELDNTWGVKRIGAGTVHDGGNKGAGVKVAIIDSGIDYNHPDLNANYAGGWDFYNDDADPRDDHGHGTHVAGTVAAEDNSSGVVGVAPAASIYALKVLGASGGGSFSDIIAALQWATDNGISVTNNSYGSSSDPGVIVRSAFDNSYSAGVLHIAAAGNSGNTAGKGDSVGYPAKYSSVVAVAATDKSDRRASFSSTGRDVELAAPGVGINSTVPGGGYEAWSGTSMASPHVAGAAAVVIASGIADANGNGKTNDDVRLRLQQTAIDLGDPGRDTFYGYGLVDTIAATLGSGQPPNATPSVSWVNPQNDDTVAGVVTIRISASDAEDAAGTLAVKWKIDGGGLQNAEYNSITGYYEASWNTTTASNSSHTLTAQATDSAVQTGSSAIQVTVSNSTGGSVAVAGINPNTMQAGTTVNVTITGSGFQSGATVSFENGGGPAPTASNFVVGADGTTVAASITTKTGGPQRNRVWDVRVTNTDGSSGVLIGGFTVTP